MKERRQYTKNQEEAYVGSGWGATLIAEVKERAIQRGGASVRGGKGSPEGRTQIEIAGGEKKGKFRKGLDQRRLDSSTS